MSDIKVFIPEDNTVKTVLGEDVKIPKLTWKKELKLITIVQETMDTLVGASVKIADSSPETLISSALRLVPNKITEFMSIVMEREVGWVEDNLDSTEIIGVILPLLKSRFDLIASRIQPFIQADQKEGVATPTVSTLPLRKNTQTIQ